MDSEASVEGKLNKVASGLSQMTTIISKRLRLSIEWSLVQFLQFPVLFKRYLYLFHAGVETKKNANEIHDLKKQVDAIYRILSEIKHNFPSKG